MLIIEQNAEQTLIAQFDAIRSNTSLSLTRCLHYKLSSRNLEAPQAKDIIQTIIDGVGVHIPSNALNIYLCEDGDVFIVSSSIPEKAAKKLQLEIAEAFQSKEPIADFYEVSWHVNKLLQIVQQKIDIRAKAALNDKMHQAIQLANRKRDAILNGEIPSIGKTADISQRRTGRSHPELMIIEDDPFSVKLVENVLRKKFSLTALHTADEALSTYAELAPDMLFLDINLPDVTGHELLEKIMALDPHAYVIMLSGNADKHNVMQAMNKGAKGFVAKPFSRDKLIEYIERCPTITATA